MTTDYSRRTKMIVFPLWGILTLATILKVTIPIANAVMICLVYGPHAYFHDGLRITDARPARFTNGEFVPGIIEFFVGFGSILVTFICVGLLLAWVVELFRRFFRRGKNSSA